MSRSPWNFGRRSRCDGQAVTTIAASLSGCGGVGAAASGVVAFDRDDEGGEVAVADDLPELPFGFEHAGGGPAQRHLARLPALHVALGAADDLDHRLARVRRLERPLQRAA